ncbi:unnamed protein product [Ilex paraguariensis]|uniref:Cathepsin propeptide inhibitor domain-containing protein n=1 Tax=Ilex paraguariensis TaxID=185542 RepID=A0ABC8RE06_9AQUA
MKYDLISSFHSPPSHSRRRGAEQSCGRRTMVGGGLTYAVSVAVLTYALTFSATLRASPRDPNIYQVTENPIPAHRKFIPNNHLLGTASELRFKSFMEKYGKTYSTTEEYVHRLGIFAGNLIRAAEHQALDPTAVHGVTQFSDLSEEEFETMFMGVKGGDGGGGTQLSGITIKAAAMEVRGLPESFDWRERGAVSEVKMQVSTVTVHLFGYTLSCYV